MIDANKPPVVLDTRVVSGKGGGPDKTILNSPRFLEPLGYRMLCAYLYPPGDPGFDEIRAKAQKYKAPLIEIPDHGPLDWRVLWKLYRICRDENVAIWHGHDYKTNLLGILLKFFHPMKLVTTAHGWVEITKRTPTYYKIDRWCLPRYERVYCVSDDLHQACRIAGVRESRCELLENGIDTEEFTRRQSTAEAKARLGFSPTSLLVGTMGRLSPEKAFDVLIRSIYHLSQAGLDIQAVIVGEGNDRPRLEQFIRDMNIGDRVRLAGYQSDVRSYYEAFDIFALSSLREGLPNVLLEAMSLEVPCVATRIAGIPRLITHNETGLLVDAGNQDQFTEAVGRLARDSQLRKNIQNQARKLILERYSFSQRMNRLKISYDRLLHRERC